jgi:hypothetical protein
MTRRVRRNDRTTGLTHWRKKRTGTKVDDCKVTRLKEPVQTGDLNTVVSVSGFDSVSDWRDAIVELHDGLDGCGLYAVGNPKMVDSFDELPLDF